MKGTIIYHLLCFLKGKKRKKMGIKVNFKAHLPAWYHRCYFLPKLGNLMTANIYI